MCTKKPIREMEPAWTTPALGLASLLAVAASSCCVLPIGLTILGLGGTWLTVLGPFAEQRDIILVGVGVALTAAWGTLFFRPGVRRQRRRASVILTLVCTMTFAAAVTAPLWERDAIRAMWSYWKEMS